MLVYITSGGSVKCLAAQHSFETYASCLRGMALKYNATAVTRNCVARHGSSSWFVCLTIKIILFESVFNGKSSLS
jgi:hypothetical protein